MLLGNLICVHALAVVLIHLMVFFFPFILLQAILSDFGFKSIDYGLVTVSRLISIRIVFSLEFVYNECFIAKFLEHQFLMYYFNRKSKRHSLFGVLQRVI